MNYDIEISKITQYVYKGITFENDTLLNAHLALIDSMGCAISALNEPHFQQHYHTIKAHFSSQDKHSVPVAGLHHRFDISWASYTLTAMIRWLDYNDTWLAREWGHPSDNTGSILSTASYMSICHQQGITMRQVLHWLIQAYEIQGVLAMSTSLNEHGHDHVLLVKIASVAVIAKIIGCSETQCSNAISNCLADGAPLRCYRHAPNTGWRKSWAAAQACQQAVQHALFARNDEMGYPSVLTTENWGFDPVIMQQDHLCSEHAYNHYVIDNILYKVSYPIEFHAQTAIEAILLQRQIFVDHYTENIDAIHSIHIDSHDAAMRIINKHGVLNNPADRDHCIQYGVAVALLYGKLKSEMYSESFASDKRIDILRQKITVSENTRYNHLYHDYNHRAIANKVTITYVDGTVTSKEVLYPLGHAQRRNEARPLLMKKFSDAINAYYTQKQADRIINSCTDPQHILDDTIDNWIDMWIPDS